MHLVRRNLFREWTRRGRKALIRVHHEFCLFIPGRQFETEDSEEQFPFFMRVTRCAPRIFPDAFQTLTLPFPPLTCDS